VPPDSGFRSTSSGATRAGPLTSRPTSRLVEASSFWPNVTFPSEFTKAVL
jgi:hypothetical protein